MATAVFPGAPRPVLVSKPKIRSFPSLSESNLGLSGGDLTIHRITKTHHGRTLLTLGHAAEYLADSRRYSTQEGDYRASVEAIHILLGLNRRVFDEFAEERRLHRRFEEWLIEPAVRLCEVVANATRPVRNV
jgi:hypothetical protein